MPVNSRHPEYEAIYERYKTTTHAVDGNVKEYVPRLSGQTEKEHESYVGRAAYYNVTERTLNSLVGALLRKPFTLEGSTEPPFTTAVNFEEFLQSCYLELLQGGRIGLLVDYDESLGSPKLVSYSSQNLINWTDQFVVIEECVLQPDPDDEFKLRNVQRWRELRLNEEGLYEVRLWTKAGPNSKPVITEILEPTARGKRLDFIPFYWVNARDNTPVPVSPPLFGLASLNIQHFCTAVDLAHGLHKLALPSAVLIGDLVSADPLNPPREIKVGGDEFIHLTQGSDAKYLEFSGAGLNAIQAQINHLEEQMFQAGSRLLTNKGGVESAEALRLRAGSETAVLNTLANALENGLNAALEVYALWGGEAKSIKLNRDFTESQMDPAELKVLLETYAAGVITLETLLTRLFEGEIVSDVQKELAGVSSAPAPVAIEPTKISA
jgi:hypothetical protein